MSDQELAAEVARLQAENESLRSAKAAPKSLSCKVSAKGAVSVYGLGRFPVTLYQEQWIRVLEFGGDIRRFMAAHKNELSVKEAA